MKRKIILISIFMIIMTAVLAVQAQTPDSGAFRQEGIASWYGGAYDGKPTASGEIYDSTKLTAAHPTLPFGSIVTITNTFNSRHVTVRINDRGPFVPARIIDLSRAAAEILDMITTGTANVIVETAIQLTAVQTPVTAQAQTQAQTQAQAQTESTAPAAEPRGSAIIRGETPEPGSGKLYRLQLGTFRIPRNAVLAFEKLEGAGLFPSYERVDEMYRVVLSRLKAEDIPIIAEIVYELGFVEGLLREER